MNDKNYTVDEAAERLRFTAYTVREWLKSGKLKGFKTPGEKGKWRIPEAALIEFEQQNTIVVPPSPNTKDQEATTKIKRARNASGKFTGNVATAPAASSNTRAGKKTAGRQK